MSGLVGADGSELVGGLYNGVPKAFAADSAGNMQVGLVTSPQNPVAVADPTKLFARNGQLFTVSTGKLTSTAAGTGALVIINNNLIKNIEIVSILLSASNAGFQFIQLLTADPAYTGVGTGTVTPTNHKVSGAASLILPQYCETNIAAPGIIGTTIATVNTVANTSYEALQNGQMILLPANTISGVGVFINLNAAGVGFSANITYAEY